MFLNKAGDIVVNNNFLCTEDIPMI